MRRWWFALVPAAVALGLGLWRLGVPGPWLDERYTMTAVIQGLPSQFWEAPMLPYYALMWLWTLGGQVTDIAWLRLPSVIAATACVGIVALTARRLSGERAAFVAALLLALAPGFSRYSQEARTYALAAAFVALATYALVVILQGGSRRWWWAYVLGLAAATPLLPVSLAAIPVHGIVMTTFPGWRRSLGPWIRACLWLVPIALGEVALAAFFSGIRDWLAPPVLADYPEIVAMIADSEYTGVAGSAVAFALVVLAALSARGVRWLLALAMAGALIWLVSYVAGGWWTDRTFMAFAGILAVAASFALREVSWPSSAALVVVVAAMAAPAHVAIREPGSRGDDVREVAAAMDAEGRPGDRVLAVLPWDLAWWSPEHLLPGDPRFTRVTEVPASGRYWEMEPEATCESPRTWAIPGGSTLRLCDASP